MVWPDHVLASRFHVLTGSPTPLDENIRVPLGETIQMGRILLVDDLVSIRNALHTLLKRHGYSCVEADDGAQALTYIHQEPFDLVITDNHMPVLRGIGLLETLSKQSHIISPPVILLSGQLNSDTRKHAFLAGAWMVFEKPYVFSELLAAIRFAINPPIHPLSFIP